VQVEQRRLSSYDAALGLLDPADQPADGVA
jgi:hypothetical protein